MQPDERDAALLWDMLDAARAVNEFVSSRKYNDYENDRMLRGAVERNIEIIGEAANHVSDAFRQAHPEIYWKGLVGQRNVLIHEYGEIKHGRIWAVATQRIPELIKLLESLIPTPPKPETE
ncbi:MAG: hypothetical protein A2X56_11015 [Nitrospirae bacterium GWC2_57_13]|jgi:uncharacterized protein with HEPN domain|nr:MAG: hypothetical protein A2X56_11015 [Nitrospirae bacterium GWC2_57_13]HAS53563.1 DUF86 domain-containing protein [Nitrospiraceae bacterium]